MNTVTYQERHIGPHAADTQAMLKAIGVTSLDALIQRTVPQGIRAAQALATGDAFTERQHLDHMKALGAKNKVFRSYIGLGFSGTGTPPPILRNIFENPGWYTAYTPYQAEIAQGRLEALLNFQTMCIDLTGLPIANASSTRPSSSCSSSGASAPPTSSRWSTSTGATSGRCCARPAR